MPIRFIDPNSRSYLDKNNKQVFLRDGEYHKENSIPQYEKMFVFAEFSAVRPTETVLVSNDPFNELNKTVSDSLLVNYIGYDQEGENEGYHTTYCGIRNRGEDKETQYNGFGIKNIDIQVTRNSITKVTIDFVDANKGESLGKKPYDILLSKVPQPFFNLKVKGYYGRTLNYALLMHKIPTITMDRDGAMLLRAEFYSNIWKVLGDLMIYEIFQVPFLKQSGSSNTPFKINNNDNPKSFYEFIIRGRKFYSDIINLKDTQKITNDISELKSTLSVLNRLNSFKDGYIEQLPDELTKNNLYTITKNFQGNNRKYIFKLNKTGIFSDLQKILQPNYEDFIITINPSIVSNANIQNFSILNISETTPNIYELNFLQYEKNIKASIDSTTKEIDDANRNLENTINDILNQNFGNGFKPTANNIFKLLCDDIDKFMNVLKDTTVKAENYHKNNTPKVDNGSGGVDIVQAFPTYAVLEKSPSGVSKLVKRFPSDKPDWFETKLIDNFFDASIYQKIAEGEDISKSGKRIEDLFAEKFDEVKENTQFNIVKEEIYYRFKRYVDKYVKGMPNQSSQYAYPFNNDSSLFEKFSFIDRAFNKIGDECILDFLPILDMDLTNTTVIRLMSELLTVNNFEQYRLENFMLHTQDTWNEAFEPLDDISIDSIPNFICQYHSSTSEYLQDDLDDSFTISSGNYPPDYNNSEDIFAFKVAYGIENQSYFKEINLSTAEHANTIESFRLADEISSLGGKTVPSIQGQSLYNIYENYSYTATITMLGCVMIQPMQYFELCHIPLFSGTYMIQEVSHQLTNKNDMLTTFVGVRVSKYVKPIVNEFVKSVDILLGSIKEEYPDDVRIKAKVLIRNKTSRYTDNNDFEELYGTESPNDYYNIKREDIDIKRAVFSGFDIVLGINTKSGIEITTENTPVITCDLGYTEVKIMEKNINERIFIENPSFFNDEFI